MWNIFGANIKNIEVVVKDDVKKVLLGNLQVLGKDTSEVKDYSALINKVRRVSKVSPNGTLLVRNIERVTVTYVVNFTAVRVLWAVEKEVLLFVIFEGRRRNSTFFVVEVLPSVT